MSDEEYQAFKQYLYDKYDMCSIHKKAYTYSPEFTIDGIKVKPEYIDYLNSFSDEVYYKQYLKDLKDVDSVVFKPLDKEVEYNDDREGLSEEEYRAIKLILKNVYDIDSVFLKPLEINDDVIYYS